MSQLSGKGVRVIPTTGWVEFLFRYIGKKDTAKVSMPIDPKQNVPDYEKTAALLAASGVPGVFAAGAVEPVTPEEFG